MGNSFTQDEEWEGGSRSTSSKFKAGLVNPGQVATKGIALKPNQGTGFDVSGPKEWNGVNVIHPSSIISVFTAYATNTIQIMDNRNHHR